MKKIFSMILCGLFLNLMIYPAVYAEMEMQPAEPVNTYNAVQYADQNTTTISDQAQSTANASVPAQSGTTMFQPTQERTEHLAVKKKNSKKIDVESVYVSAHDAIIPAQDILQLAFVSDFNGRRAHIGDTIEFRFPNDIVTQEGTMIIPSTARVIAEITDLKRPKPFHLSGKVYLNFKYIEINGVRKPIEARLYSKKDFLSRKTLNSTAAVGETAVTAGAGAAAGAAICAATATDVAVVVFGTAITAGVGAIVGAAVGILLPGAAFKAKAGQTVSIQLTQELDI